MSYITRRNLLKYSALGLGSIVVSTGLTGCDDDDNSQPEPQPAPIPMSFTHGIASGDPLTDSVIIWTRALPEDTTTHTELEVNFEVATDENFSNIVNNGTHTVNQQTDFILKVDVQNLAAGTDYFYRFTSNGKTSAIGQTKTLPDDSASLSQVKFAVFSCSNYPTGYFNAYTEAEKLNDLDAVLHLGDYIYEYKMGEYATENAAEIGRALPEDNDVELIKLDDYRKRYALYRTDRGLQALHQKVPFIVVPDDHEVANDTYIDGAENHDPAKEGDFTTRKTNALQAYFEWLPIRPAAQGDNETLYRSFKWGNLVNLLMLDTRLIGRTKQLSLTDPQFYNPDQSFNAQAFMAAITSDQNSLLGVQQLNWLTSELSNSSATWQVLGQQVLMGRMNLPLEVLLALGQNPSAVTNALSELVTIKGRMLAGDPTVTDAEKARVLTAAPYNLDAWDGYQYEREVIFNYAQQLMKNLIVLAGDTHNAWANNLTLANGDAVGVELATPGVTSPGMEKYLSLDAQNAMGLEQGLNILIDDLQYSNLYDRGLMLVTFTEQHSQAEWLFVDTIASENYAIQSARSHNLTINVGENKIA